MKLRAKFGKDNIFKSRGYLFGEPTSRTSSMFGTQGCTEGIRLSDSDSPRKLSVSHQRRLTAIL